MDLSAAPRAGILASQIPGKVAPVQVAQLSQLNSRGNPAGNVIGVLYTQCLTSFMLGCSFSLDKDRLAPSLVDGMKILSCIMAYVIALVAVVWGS